MNRHSQLLWIGLLIYAISFFLASAGPSDASKPLRGYFCATVTLLFSWEEVKLWIHGAPSIYNLLEYLSVLVSGWINPVFLVGLLVTSVRPSSSSFTLARISLILAIPACWIVFYYHQLYPREGHFLWIVGMFMVLFSNHTPLARPEQLLTIGGAKTISIET